jgi:hypothetical protein
MNQIDDNEKLLIIYNEFIKTNRVFWDEFSPAPSSLGQQVVLVDCLVDFPPYILGNLIVAKYLQKRTNARIFAVVRDKSQAERNLTLLKSFSVEEVFLLNRDIPLKINLDLSKIAYERDVKKFRKIVLDFSIDGIRIGDLIYDAFLRDTGLPTITALDKSLTNYFYLAIKYYKIYSSIFKSHDITATIQGHTVYLMYGMLARVAAKHGASVFGRKPGSSPTGIRKYTSLNELPGFELGYLKEHFNYVAQNKKTEALIFAKNFLTNRLYGNCEVAGYQKDKKKYEKSELLDILKLSTQKPTAIIMPHVFSDAPHMESRMIHNDYFEWFQDTMDIVSRIPDVNWIIKPHPQDKYYNGDIDYAVFEAKKYVDKFDHIALMPDNFHGSGIVDIADAIVTVRGTAALEFSSLGIPCIITGNIYFSDDGFAIEAKTKQDYINLLNNIKTLEKLSNNKAEDAMVSSYMYYNLILCNCVFIPNVKSNWYSNFNSLDFWEEALESILSKSIMYDPLYNCFNYMLDNNLPYLIQYYELFDTK